MRCSSYWVLLGSLWAPMVLADLSAEQVYQQHCGICHENGVAGAPKYQNTTDWSPRLEKAGGIDGLLAHALEGMNAMPPKGTCQECSSDEVKQAIEYMLPKG